MLAPSRLHASRPFTSVAPAGGHALRSVAVCAVRKVENKLSPVNDDVDLSSAGTSQARAQAAPQLRTRSASQDDRRGGGGGGGDDRRGRRRDPSDVATQKHFLPLPKPAHLVYIKPTVAVVVGMASRSSVGVKMTAGAFALERYVIEYYARSVK